MEVLIIRGYAMLTSAFLYVRKRKKLQLGLEFPDSMEPGYHRAMKTPWATIFGWFFAVLLAALAWVAWWRPEWAPIVLVAAVSVYRLVDRTRNAEPWGSGLVALSSLAFLLTRGSWEIAAGWLLLACLVGVVASTLPRRDGGRPDAADFLALGGWGMVFVLAPRMVSHDHGGWLAPALLILAVERLVRSRDRIQTAGSPSPPSLQIRGTLSLDEAVVAGRDALPRSVPLNLEMRAGDSLGILCDSPAEAAAFAELLCGRAKPAAGEVMVDGLPLASVGPAVAVVASGEEFVPGDLETNLAALGTEPLTRDVVAALHEACSLGEVVEMLGDRMLDRDGSPLPTFHRFLVLAARVIPSSFRMVVVVDPMPWVNAVRGELWRAAVVRASVGRTAIWLTPDRELVHRATHVMEYRQGSLRPLAPALTTP
jgi:hypothetical protein